MREIAIFSIIGFFFGCLFSCNNISNAIYDRKVYNVQRLSEKYLKINYSSKWETVEYEVKPFVDTLDHDKKNDIFFIKHTIRNSETYDSLLTTHQSTDTFMDGFKESQKLNVNDI